MIWNNRELDRLQARLERADAALERVVDEALVAAGRSAIYHPEAHHLQPRPLEAPGDGKSAAPLSRRQQRHMLEAEAAEEWEKARKRQLIEELKACTQARPNPPAEEAQ